MLMGDNGIFFALVKLSTTVKDLKLLRYWVIVCWLLRPHACSEQQGDPYKGCHRGRSDRIIRYYTFLCAPGSWTTKRVSHRDEIVTMAICTYARLDISSFYYQNYFQSISSAVALMFPIFSLNYPQISIEGDKFLGTVSVVSFI